MWQGEFYHGKILDSVSTRMSILHNNLKLGIIIGMLLASAVLIPFMVLLYDEPEGKSPSVDKMASSKSSELTSQVPPSQVLFKALKPVIPDAALEEVTQANSAPEPISAQVGSEEINSESSTVERIEPSNDAEAETSVQKRARTQQKNLVMQGSQKQQKGTQFIKVSFNGEPLAGDARRWSCARDQQTGLLWETKLFDAGISDAEHTYSWYDPGQAHSGYRDRGRCFGIACDTAAYTLEMNRIDLCASNQWRLPTFDELQTLLDRDYFNPTINQKIFTHARSASYWTSTQLEFDSDMIMQIDFFNGTSSPAPIRYALSLRLVSP